MQLTPLIAFHMSSAIAATLAGAIALWARRHASPLPWLHRIAGYGFVLLMLATAASSVALWWGVGTVAPRELAEAAGLIPLLALFWRWRPPPPFEKPTDEPPQAETTGTP